MTTAANAAATPEHDGRETLRDAETRAHCLANWPDAHGGDYNPRCCRFPKSCSIPALATSCASYDPSRDIDAPWDQMQSRGLIERTDLSGDAR